MSAADNEKQVRESIEHIADRAAKNAVRDVLLLIGIDANNPVKAQEDMMRLRALADERTRANLEWLDRLRTASDRVADTSWRTITRLAITGLVGLFLLMSSEYWTKHLPWK